SQSPSFATAGRTTMSLISRRRGRRAGLVREVLGARFDALELNALVRQVVGAGDRRAATEDLARRWRRGRRRRGWSGAASFPALRREAGSAARTRCVERIVVRAPQPAVVDAPN